MKRSVLNIVFPEKYLAFTYFRGKLSLSSLERAKNPFQTYNLKMKQVSLELMVFLERKVDQAAAAVRCSAGRRAYGRRLVTIYL